MYRRKHPRRTATVFLLMVSILLLFLLAACAENTLGIDASDASPAISVSSEPTAPVKNPAETKKPAEIPWTEDDLCGMLFVDYVARDTFDAYKLSSRLPSWGDTPDALWYDMGGTELFLIVPRYPESTLTVNEYKDGEDNPVGAEIYSGPAHPVFVLCNISDIRPDCLITVEYEEKSVSFYPFLSLKDGQVILPNGGGVLNLAPAEEKPADAQTGEVLLGKWSLVSEDYSPDGFWIHTLEFFEEGKMTLLHGPPFAEAIEIFEGTYSITPGGSFTFSLDLIYSAMFDGVVSKEDSYSLEGTYGYSFKGENFLQLTHSKGHLFIYDENPPDLVTYRFERATEEFEARLLEETAVG